MLCAARGSPIPTLEWRKDGVVISTNTTSTTEEEVNGQLVIPRFGPADQGVYTCFFKNYNNGTAETAATASKAVIIKIKLNVSLGTEVFQPKHLGHDCSHEGFFKDLSK